MKYLYKRYYYLICYSNRKQEHTMNEQNNKKVILLVEDEAIVAMIQKRILEKQDYQVIIANDGKTAIEIALNNPAISLILMDINLGDGIDGTQAAEMILARKDIPLIFFSSHTEQEIVDKTEGITSYGYILKTAGETVLIASIRMAYKLFESKLQVQEEQKKLYESKEKYRLLHEKAGLAIGYYTPDGIVISYNKHALTNMNMTEKEVVNKSIYELFRKEDADIYMKRITEVIKSDKKMEYEDKIDLPAGSYYLNSTYSKICDEQENLLGVQIISKDITESKEEEEEKEIILQLLALLNMPNKLTELIPNIINLLRRAFGFEAVGIRIKKDDDYPYYETYGFNDKFVMLETHLCARDEKNVILRNDSGIPIYECMCGNVIMGRFDSKLPFFTEFGSFWSNNTSRLLATTTDSDRQTRTRNRCNGEGYESVALIPMRYGNKGIGLIQFNDRRENMFTLRKIALFERIASNLVNGIVQRLTEEELINSEERFRLATVATNSVIWDWDIKKDIKVWNEAIKYVFGWDNAGNQNLKALWWEDKLHPEDKKRVIENFNMTINDPIKVFWQEEYRFMRIDGTYTSVVDKGYILRQKDGNAIRAIGAIVIR